MGKSINTYVLKMGDYIDESMEMLGEMGLVNG